MRLLPAASRTAVPWRNGGGTTTEITAFPEDAGLGGFDWRISIARIDRDGPFSAFPGVERTLVLLSGGPLLLAGPHWQAELREQAASFRFDGGDPVQARIGEPATVLNIMTRRGAWVHDSAKHGPCETLLLALRPMTLGDVPLEPFDAAWFAPGEAMPPAPRSDEAIRIASIPICPERTARAGEILNCTRPPLPV